MKSFLTYIQLIASKHGWRLVAHCAILVLLIWIPMQLIDQLAERIFQRQSPEEFFRDPFKGVIFTIFLAPLLETLGMRFLFSWIRRVWRGDFALYFVSSVLWGAMHYPTASWGLHAAWAFFILGAVYLSLEPVSRDRAFLLTALIHALCNALSYLAYILTK